MEPGQISTPIATNAGFYILLVQNREEGRARNALNNKFDIMTVAFPAETSADDIKKFVESFRTCRRRESAETIGKVARSGLKTLNFRADTKTVINLEAGQVADHNRRMRPPKAPMFMWFATARTIRVFRFHAKKSVTIFFSAPLNECAPTFARPQARCCRGVSLRRFHA